MLLWMSSSEWEGRAGGLAGCSEVVGDGAVDVSGDVALEASDDFFAGSAFGETAGHVGLGGGVPSESADDDDVERCVGLAVAASVEPVSLLTPG